MKHFKNFFIGVITVLFSAASFTANAQQLKLSSGVKDGTYYTMINQAIVMCATDGSVVNVEQPGGTPATISAIQANQVGGGAVQFDALWMRSRGQDLTFIKTLLPLHTEQVHIVASSKDIKKGGFLSIGGDVTNISDTRFLKGLTVGASGGSIYTAQAINQLSGLGYLVNSEFTSDAAVLAALDKGTIAAGIFVGGAPMKSISKLNRNYKLVPFDPTTIEKLKDVYRPKAMVYDNLGITSVNTVETDALLVVNNFTGKKMVDLLTKFRECVKTNLDDIREGDGSHPAWRTVNFNRSEKPRWAVWGTQ